MSAQSSQLLADLVKFFNDRDLHEVAQGLASDLKQTNKQMESDVLDVVRKAVTRSDRYHMASQNTNERKNAGTAAHARAELDLMPKSQSDAIMEKLVTKMVQNPTPMAQEREQQLNKRIERVFELESFQKMVENSDENALFRDIQSTKAFISQSELI